MKKNLQGGYALVTALVFFLAGTTAVIGAITDGVLREIRTVRNESSSKQSYFATESSLEDAIYRIKTGKQIDSTETLSVGTSYATTTVSIVDGSKEITASGDAAGTIRTIQSKLKASAGISFPYAFQSGLGGIDLAGGATVSGDIYTSGSIRGCGTCAITGMAVAAGKSTSDLDQDNSNPATPTQSIIFGNANGSQDLAQSFTISEPLSITELELYVKKTGNPANATIKIVNDASGRPGSSVYASGTLSSSLVGTTYQWIDIVLTANPILVAGTTYWIVVDANSNSSNYYIAAANSGSYSDGEALVGRYTNNSWNNTTPAGLDAYLKISIGTNEEGIAGESQYERLPVQSAYSYKASFVSATGALYCQIGADNNKDCDTSRADPAVQGDPVSDVTIAAFKSDAASGESTGDVTVGSSGDTLGPQKISGNLTISNGGILEVSGTLWVTGNVTIEGGSIVRPADSAKSYAIIADGTISLSGGAEITGTPGSYILLLSTSAADPAITINGGANDTVVFVPDGGLFVSGGAHVKAAAAKHISADGGAQIIYDPDISEIDLGSYESEGEFEVRSWKETE